MDDAGPAGQGRADRARASSPAARQNEIYEIRRGDLHAASCASRRPRRPADRDEGILREWRIIEALDGTDVPHTAGGRACATTRRCSAGTFYLMGFVDGWSPMDQPTAWPAPFDTDLDARAGPGLPAGRGHRAAVEGRLAGQGPRRTSAGPTASTSARSTAGPRFLERIKGRELPGFDEAAAWLRAHRPIDFIPGLMHGDYQFANVMYRHGAPARLAAIVDWEMGTVGDPKLDLGWVVQSWPEDTDAPEARESGYVDMTRHAVARRRCSRTTPRCPAARSTTSTTTWCWPSGSSPIVLEQGFQRAGDDEKLQAFGPIVLDLMQGAAELAETTDYRRDRLRSANGPNGHVRVAGDVRHVDPAQAGLVDVEPPPARGELLDRDAALHARQRGAEAAVHAVAEPDGDARLAARCRTRRRGRRRAGRASPRR